ncbi:MAG: hypothetical protein RR091_10760 [Cloacibacillus sp.]
MSKKETNEATLADLTPAPAVNGEGTVLNVILIPTESGETIRREDR